jgi:hypothetical protein
MQIPLLASIRIFLAMHVFEATEDVRLLLRGIREFRPRSMRSANITERPAWRSIILLGIQGIHLAHLGSALI